jgi:predicted ATP-grasp superfamily ATP-dependent carboligase
LPAGEILEKAQDKRETLRIALECDIPIPQTTFCKSLDELEKLSKGLRYPVVVKSRYSKYWSGSGRVQSGGTRYVSSAEELVSVYQKLHGLIPDPLIQEFISGQGCAVSLLMDQGEPKALFAHRRIHEENPMGGPSALAEGITPDPRMTEDAVRLLQRMRWQGVAMVEFKQNRRDGTHKLMEVNGRFWGSLPLAIASGVDFPYLLYQSLTGGRVEPVLQYQTGLRGRHLKGEISYLLGVLKGPPSGWREPYPTLASTFADFIKCGRRKTVSYNYSISDPAPGLLEIYDVLFRQLPRSMMGRIVGKRSKGS